MEDQDQIFNLLISGLSNYHDLELKEENDIHSIKIWNKWPLEVFIHLIPFREINGVTDITCLEEYNIYHTNVHKFTNTPTFIIPDLKKFISVMMNYIKENNIKYVIRKEFDSSNLSISDKYEIQDFFMNRLKNEQTDYHPFLKPNIYLDNVFTKINMKDNNNKYFFSNYLNNKLFEKKLIFKTQKKDECLIVIPDKNEICKNIIDELSSVTDSFIF